MPKRGGNKHWVYPEHQWPAEHKGLGEGPTEAQIAEDAKSFIEERVNHLLRLPRNRLNESHLTERAFRGGPMPEENPLSVRERSIAQVAIKFARQAAAQYGIPKGAFIRNDPYNVRQTPWRVDDIEKHKNGTFYYLSKVNDHGTTDMIPGNNAFDVKVYDTFTRLANEALDAALSEKE